MKSPNICNIENLLEIHTEISLPTSKTANTRCPGLGNIPVRCLAPVIRGVFSSSFQPLSEVTTLRNWQSQLTIDANYPRWVDLIIFKQPTFTWRDFSLYFWSFFKDNMSNPNFNSLNCFCCGKYNCKTEKKKSDKWLAKTTICTHWPDR